MTSITIVSLVTLTAIVIAGTGIAVYYAGPQLEQAVQSPEPGDDQAIGLAPAQELVSPEPVASDDPSASTTRSNVQVQGTTTQQPSPSNLASPTPTRRPTPTPTPIAASNDLAIAFVDTPSQVNAGESFVVKWQVTGPAGTTGQDSAIKLSYDVDKSSNGSSSSISTNNSSSFGSFTVPKVFSSKFSLGKEPGQIHLTATASVGGETLTTTKTIELR